MSAYFRMHVSSLILCRRYNEACAELWPFVGVCAVRFAIHCAQIVLDI